MVGVLLFRLVGVADIASLSGLQVAFATRLLPCFISNWKQAAHDAVVGLNAKDAANVLVHLFHAGAHLNVLHLRAPYYIASYPKPL